MAHDAAESENFIRVEEHVTGVRRLAGFRTASRGPVVQKANQGVAL